MSQLASRLQTCDGNALRVDGLLPVEVRWNETASEGQNTNHGFNRARGTRGVSCKRLGGRKRRQRRAEEPVHRCQFAPVVVGRRRSVCVDIVDVLRRQPSLFQCLTHCQIRTVRRLRRGRLVKRIAGVAISRQNRQRLMAVALRRLWCFEHHISRALSQVESGACLAERPAGRVVEDEERIETVEMEFRQAFRASRHRHLRLSAFQHPRGMDDGVGRRGTRGGR